MATLAIRYWKEHPNLGISKSPLSTWGKSFDSNEGSVPTRDVAIMKVTRQRKMPASGKKDTQDALEILKKPSAAYWEND